MPDNPPTPYSERPPSSPSADEAARGDTTSTPKHLPTAEDFPDSGPNALASFAQRAWARVIDEVITDLPFIVVLSLLAVSTMTPDGQPTEATEKVMSELPWWFIPGSVTIAVVYEICAIAWKGQTIGKWVLGIRVARYTDGTRPTLEQAALRCLLPAVAGVAALSLTGASAIGVFAVLASAYFLPLRRGWHDQAGGTVVVRTR